MELRLSVRHLLLATWELAPDQVQRDLPRGLEPAVTRSGAALVSLVAFRNERVRAGRGFRWPSFAQVNVRTYVAADAGPAVFFLSFRVTAAGLAGAAFGAPYRPARIRVREGQASAPGLGLDVRYRPLLTPPRALEFDAERPADDIGYFLAAGLRRLRVAHARFDWREAELVEDPRFEPLLALGFDVEEPVSLLYAAATDFTVDLPPAKA